MRATLGNSVGWFNRFFFSTSPHPSPAPIELRLTPNWCGASRADSPKFENKLLFKVVVNIFPQEWYVIKIGQRHNPAIRFIQKQFCGEKAVLVSRRDLI